MKTEKKIHRFLLSSIPHGTVGDALTVDDARVVHQVHRVLRIQPGEVIIVFGDGGPNVSIELIDTTGHALTGQIKAIDPVSAVPRTVIAAVSIVKGNAFELVVQKLTEMGIATIVPLITARTVKQAVRIDRLQAISDEALEQSGGTRRVSIAEPLSLSQCFEQFPHPSVVLDPLAEHDSIEKSFDAMVFYVGPEGGWDEQDEAIISFYNPHYIKITNRILRTETAAILGAYTLLWK
jgi:16S rRNA (uracil1498-N3)-methyltransferase